MQETWVRFLGWEDPLENEMAIHSSILAWKIPWTESLVGYSPWGERVGQDLATKPPNLIKQNLVCTRNQEKGAATPQETDPGLPVSVQESPVETWVGNGLLQGWGH